MKVQAFVGVEIRDRHGHLKYFSRKEANSFVIALLDSLYTQFAVVNNQSIKDTSNTPRSCGYATANEYTDGINCQAAIGVTNTGIVVGTGTNVVTISDYALQTLIAHGTGSGQLEYGVVAFVAPTTVGSTRKFTLSRTLINGSGGTINVTEIGIYAKIYDSAAAARFFCIDRTLNSFSIENTLSATITYTISVTV